MSTVNAATLTNNCYLNTDNQVHRLFICFIKAKTTSKLTMISKEENTKSTFSPLQFDLTQLNI